MRYRRTYIPGGLYFFTLATENRRKLLATADSIQILRQAFRHVMKNRPFVVEAAVILPDHLHCIWRLPKGDQDYPTRWRLIKTWFTKNSNLPSTLSTSHSKIKKVEKGFWQRRYWEHCLRDEADFLKHLEYIHFNPVKHGLVNRPEDWPYSTIHRNIRAAA